MDDALATLLAAVEGDEIVRARGMAVRQPVVVTDRRLLRAGDEGVVSIPWDAVTDGEVQRQGHRWSICLHHLPIDPLRRPSDATQWWRWHDRRRYRRQTQRMWRRTELWFSREHTEAADAIARALTERGIDPTERAARPTLRSSGETGWRSPLVRRASSDATGRDRDGRSD